MDILLNPVSLPVFSVLALPPLATIHLDLSPRPLLNISVRFDKDSNLDLDLDFDLATLT